MCPNCPAQQQRLSLWAMPPPSPSCVPCVSPEPRFSCSSPLLPLVLMVLLVHCLFVLHPPVTSALDIAPLPLASALTSRQKRWPPGLSYLSIPVTVPSSLLGMKEASTPTSFITSAPELGSTDQRGVCEQHVHTMFLCTPGSLHLPSFCPASWLVPWVSGLLL